MLRSTTRLTINSKQSRSISLTHLPSSYFHTSPTNMTRVLLTGGSGFIAAHVLDLLLERGHSVVTTVRSQEKADKIKAAHPNVSKDKLDFAIVEDIAQEGAFEKAVVSDPPFEAVIHTASPFHFNVKDAKKDLLDPAIIGTTGVLTSIGKSAPTVKRVVITSSFASILDTKKPDGGKGYTYSESDWNPVTMEQAQEDPATAYRASKTFAEKAAWDFQKKEDAKFSIATICPPLVLGPIVHYLNSLDALNTSNQRIRNIAFGQAKDEIPETGTFLWVDVRDIALAHVKAMELEEAGNKRYFITAGHFSNKEIAGIITKNFPELKDVPSQSTKGGDYPKGSKENVYGYNNKRSIDVLGLKYRSLEGTIVDAVKSMQEVQK